MYENTAKTISADSRLKAAYMARLKGVMPAMPFSTSGIGNGPSGFFETSGDAEDYPELVEFLGHESTVFNGFDEEGQQDEESSGD